MFSLDSNPKRITPIISLASIFFITLCLLLSSSTVMAADQKAVVQTTAADYSSAAHAVVNVNPVGGPRTTQVDLFGQATSDFIVRSFGDYFYLLGRYKKDNMTKFHIDAPTEPLWQVSLAVEGENSPNAHDLVFVGSEKAYLPMYGWTKCWIVNPKDGSKIGELDLSAYADADGIPEMHGGVIIGKKLFLLMMRVNRDNNWDPEVPSYVAVFDITTDTEIDTTAASRQINNAGLKGIELPGRNASGIIYLPENNTIYISAPGKYPGYGTPALEYTGGLITINPDTYETKLLIDDGDAANHPYYAIAGVMLASATKGYLVSYEGMDASYNSIMHLFPFNPTTGAVDAELADFNGKSMDVMDSGYSPRDENGQVWASLSGGEGNIYVINPDTNAIDEKVSTNLDPGSIAYCPQTIWPGSNMVNSPTGTGPIQYAFSGGTLGYFKAVLESELDPPPTPLDGTEFKDGLASFQVSDVTAVKGENAAAAGSLEVTLTFPTAIKSGNVYYAVGADGDYHALDTAKIRAIDAYTVILTLTDGDTWDQDGEVDGVITHVGAYDSDPENDGGTTGGGGDGGGGCFIGNTR